MLFWRVAYIAYVLFSVEQSKGDDFTGSRDRWIQRPPSGHDLCGNEA